MLEGADVHRYTWPAANIMLNVARDGICDRVFDGLTRVCVAMPGLWPFLPSPSPVASVSISAYW